MKLRIYGNSARFRIDREEAEQLQQESRGVHATLGDAGAFAGPVLEYSVRVDSEAAASALCWGRGSLEFILSPTDLAHILAGDSITCAAHITSRDATVESFSASVEIDLTPRRKRGS